MFKQLISKRPQSIDASIGSKNPGYDPALISKTLKQAKAVDSREGLYKLASQAAAEQRLREYPAYGINASSELLERNLKGVDVFTGNRGIQVANLGSPNNQGLITEYSKPVVGNQFLIGVREPVNNLLGLSVLAHEGSHNQLGHINSGNYPEGTVLPPRQRKGIQINQAEAEAELAAIETLNRLGYGYTPGLVEKSGRYLSQHLDKLPDNASKEVLLNARAVAAELVPERVRRFGPLSRKDSDNLLDNPFVQDAVLLPAPIVPYSPNPRAIQPYEIPISPTTRIAQTVSSTPDLIPGQKLDEFEADINAGRINPYILYGGSLAGGLVAIDSLNKPEPRKAVLVEQLMPEQLMPDTIFT